MNHCELLILIEMYIFINLGCIKLTTNLNDHFCFFNFSLLEILHVQLQHLFEDHVRKLSSLVFFISLSVISLKS